jgi:hypothetical protein
MAADRVLAQRELTRDVCVAEAPDEESQHLALARRE